MIRRVMVAMLVAALGVNACSSESTLDGGAGGLETTDDAGTQPPDSSPDTSVTEPDVTDAGETTVSVDETPFPVVKTNIKGSTVAGSSGTVIPGGGSDAESEVLRHENGQCLGWRPDGVDTWTEGLESGAAVTFLDENNRPIGTGVLGTSSWVNADPSNEDEPQWVCVFPFTGEVEGPPERFRIKVADLPPWNLTRDASREGEWVASVDSDWRIDGISSCTDPDTFLDQVSRWEAVGVYWHQGFQSLCANGLAVSNNNIKSVCRPAEIGSDRIVEVTTVGDQPVVLENYRDGVIANVDELPVRTEVMVYVATGRPC